MMTPRKTRRLEAAREGLWRTMVRRGSGMIRFPLYPGTYPGTFLRYVGDLVAPDTILDTGGIPAPALLTEGDEPLVTEGDEYLLTEA